MDVGVFFLIFCDLSLKSLTGRAGNCIPDGQIYVTGGFGVQGFRLGLLGT